MKEKMTMIREAGQSSHKQNNTKISPENLQDSAFSKNSHYSPLKSIFTAEEVDYPHIQ